MWPIVGGNNVAEGFMNNVFGTFEYRAAGRSKCQVGEFLYLSRQGQRAAPTNVWFDQAPMARDGIAGPE